MTAALSAAGISVRFGAVQALTEVDLEVGGGKLVGLIGPNGAGKTTFIDAITGFVSASGAIQLEGHDISRMPPHRRARLGLARTWQTIELFDDLSVRENLAVAARRPSLASSFAEIVFGREPRAEQLAEESLGLLDLDDIADAMPSDLPQGSRKLVGIARSLAASPRVLLLDEPAAGLDTHESQDLGQRLRRVVDAGLSALLVDHDMGLVLGICDEIYVLDFGKVIARGSPEEVWSNPDVLAAYLGAGGARDGGRRSAVAGASADASGTRARGPEGSVEQ
ncbi:MAG TPA: ABC transporter ATP-binding protein [Acidimicrobiales bacterium]|nr:ABC transporter ATP-binding protein [Acidimicrobiales bacterium]